MIWSPGKDMPDLAEDEQWERPRTPRDWPALLFAASLGALVGAAAAMLIGAAL
jgi:hypothetical protein